MTSPAGRPHRPVRTAVVIGSERLSRDMVRVHLEGEDVATIGALETTDSYIKIIFPPRGADYAWPFDPEQVRLTLPREQWPVTRTYTIRSHDPRAGRMSIDFVIHGDDGLAGPWALRARPGDVMAFRGPGGGWAPPSTGHLLLAGDEAAAPAIAAALDALPHGVRASVFVEVADESTHLPLRLLPGIDVTWVHRDEIGEAHGVALSRAVREAGLPAGEVHAFIHGNADMIKQLRAWLFVEHRVPRENVSISGYWRTGQDEDAWQATKRDFVASMEAEQDR
ncbi:siderophore-interacting protein [Luteococcus peritonei]|uniref:Siderophore-interacting protein n=1 Tax=Luteococcus peritonei TaxID=88874 RepID=A0ABW4RT27_9ACTN